MSDERADFQIANAVLVAPEVLSGLEEQARLCSVSVETLVDIWLRLKLANVRSVSENQDMLLIGAQSVLKALGRSEIAGSPDTPLRVDPGHRWVIEKDGTLTPASRDGDWFNSCYPSDEYEQLDRWYGSVIHVRGLLQAQMQGAEVVVYTHPCTWLALRKKA